MMKFVNHIVAKVVGGVEAPPDYKDAVLFSLQDDEVWEICS